jgi:serine/threonine protein kinase
MPTETSVEALRAIGPYDLVETTARGAAATVFAARCQQTGKRVALKAIFPPLSREEVLLKRLEQEFRVSNTLVHANLVRALDFGRVDDVVYLVTELVDGPNLAERIVRDRSLSEAEAVRVVVQAAHGLHYAHKHGIVHRDVQPRNLLLGPKGQVKVADWGSIKDLETDIGLTGPNESMGAPSFMAPEQFWDAKRAGVRGDVYALGATLYVAVTGQLPFQGGVSSILKKKLANDLAPPRRLVPTLSERVERAILRAVRADPDVRPRSCLEFAKALTTDQSETATAKLARPAASKAKRTRPPAVERRASVRYACDVSTECRRNASIHPTEEHQDAWDATVRDLSSRGAGLLLGRRFEVGTVAILELLASAGGDSVKVEMRVDRVDRAGRNAWFIGGTFTRTLEKEELRSLL